MQAFDIGGAESSRGQVACWTVVYRANAAGLLEQIVERRWIDMAKSA
ncbi:MAG: hypothetical protein AAGC71_08790 [Pseudomonadota bacterium]